MYCYPVDKCLALLSVDEFLKMSFYFCPETRISYLHRLNPIFGRIQSYVDHLVAHFEIYMIDRRAKNNKKIRNTIFEIMLNSFS